MHRALVHLNLANAVLDYGTSKSASCPCLVQQFMATMMLTHTTCMQFVAEKTEYALSKGLKVILCVGETLEQRESNQTFDVISKQVKPVADKVKDWSKIVVAYEPVWAIGTGKVASKEQVRLHWAPMCSFHCGATTPIYDYALAYSCCSLFVSMVSHTWWVCMACQHN